jgi:hypothetical protein
MSLHLVIIIDSVFVDSRKSFKLGHEHYLNEFVESTDLFFSLFLIHLTARTIYYLWETPLHSFKRNFTVERMHHSGTVCSHCLIALIKIRILDHSSQKCNNFESCTLRDSFIIFKELLVRMLCMSLC